MTTGLLVHNVYFLLKDRSTAAIDALISSCRKYLTVQPGIAYFACGSVAKELNREVNDQDWDVGLLVVFVDKAAHDAYQVDHTHEKFIEENKHNWAKVRVFDAISGPV